MRSMILLVAIRKHSLGTYILFVADTVILCSPIMLVDNTQPSVFIVFPIPSKIEYLVRCIVRALPRHCPTSSLQESNRSARSI